MDRPEPSGYDLLRKTELHIEGVFLEGANLNQVAAAAAEVLGFEASEVLVTDYQRDRMTIDVLTDSADAHNIVGRERELLLRLSELPGVDVGEEAAVRSEGMLGWIAFERGEAERALERSREMAEEIRRRVLERALVISTGPEVAGGQVEDTNQPAIAARLEPEGYRVSRGPALEDDEALISARIREAASEEGYGLVITTGGVGAEEKDRTVEAVQAVDPDAAAPYICRFEVGTGRHHKDGVRIAVGRVCDTLVVALPGPNDEVRAAMEVLVDGLREGWDKQALAEAIAGELRGILRAKTRGYQH